MTGVGALRSADAGLADFPNTLSQPPAKQAAQGRAVDISDLPGNRLDIEVASAQQVNGALDSKILKIREG